MMGIVILAASYEPEFLKFFSTAVCLLIEDVGYFEQQSHKLLSNLMFLLSAIVCIKWVNKIVYWS